MKNQKLKMLIRTCSILTSIAVFTVFVGSAHAEDSVESLEGTTSDLQNELSSLNNDLDALKIPWNLSKALHPICRMNYPL